MALETVGVLICDILFKHMIREFLMYFEFTFHYTTGRGRCDCESNKCMCDREENTRLRYGGEICECDPLQCYNAASNSVRHFCFVLCHSLVHVCAQFDILNPGSKVCSEEAIVFYVHLDS